MQFLAHFMPIGHLGIYTFVTWQSQGILVSDRLNVENLLFWNYMYETKWIVTL